MTFVLLTVGLGLHPVVGSGERAARGREVRLSADKPASMTSSKWASRTCRTSFQYTPLDSLAACGQPSASRSWELFAGLYQTEVTHTGGGCNVPSDPGPARASHPDAIGLDVAFQIAAEAVLLVEGVEGSEIDQRGDHRGSFRS